MATRPARPRPKPPRPAQAQSAKAQAAKARSATAQAAKTQAASTQAARTQAARTQAARTQAAEPSQPVAPPRELRLAAAIQALEAAGMLVAAGFAAVATVRGKSYEISSGIALSLIAAATAVLFAAFARGLARARPWTRTPVVMFQLAIGFWGVFLLTGHRYGWAVPMLLLPAVILVAIFTPASLRALNRPPRQP
jgi:hypothetical protein